MPVHQTVAIRARLTVVVSVSCGAVALGVTGTGLLLPGGDRASWVRVVGAVVAIAAGGALLRLDGPGRGSTTLVSASVVGVLVCLATLPASPVTVPWDAPADPGQPGDAPDGGSGVGPDVVVDPGATGGAGSGAALGLPTGADVVVEDGSVLLTLPDGGRITIGGATRDGAEPGIAPAGAAVVVVDGVATRDDGGALGPDVALGGVTVERSDGTQVSIGDDGLLDVPPPLDSAEPADRLDALLAVLLSCFALIAFAPPVIRFSDRVGPLLIDDEDEPAVIDGGARGATVEEGLADVLRSMLADPDPRTSVIGAYARLLTALAEAGFPRRSEEGPHEHLWRSLGPLGVRRQPVHQLAELFVRARFTPRPVTDEHRQAAITALADAVADLRLQATDVREAAARLGVPA